MKRANPVNHLPHSSYLYSRLWLDRHPQWLKQCDYQCSTFFWVTIGRKVKGKYHRYHIHHTHYPPDYQGDERLWWDVLPLCPFAHWIIHRVLGGSDGAAAPQGASCPQPTALLPECCPADRPCLVSIACCWEGYRDGASSRWAAACRAELTCLNSNESGSLKEFK